MDIYNTSKSLIPQTFCFCSLQTGWSSKTAITMIWVPKNFEPKLLKAVELWHKAMLDNSAITVWAKKGHNAQFDPKNPDYQKYSRLDSISFNGIWFHVFQYRYPSHPTAKFIKEQMSPQARSLKTDGYLGFGVGCIYNALANKEM